MNSFDIKGYLIFYSLAIGTMLLVILLWVSSWRTLLRTLAVKISPKERRRIEAEEKEKFLEEESSDSASNNASPD